MLLGDGTKAREALRSAAVMALVWLSLREIMKATLLLRKVARAPLGMVAGLRPSPLAISLRMLQTATRLRDFSYE